MKTIGYFSQANPFTDRKAWSGTIFKIRESIEQSGYKVIWIPVDPKGYGRYINLILKLFSTKESTRDHTNIAFWLKAKMVNKKLIEKCDYLFFPGGGTNNKIFQD